MEGNLLVIDKRVLPEVFEKVINAKRLLKEGKVKEITEAAKQAGISRSVYLSIKTIYLNLQKPFKVEKLYLIWLLLMKREFYHLF